MVLGLKHLLATGLLVIGGTLGGGFIWGSNEGYRRGVNDSIGPGAVLISSADDKNPLCVGQTVSELFTGKKQRIIISGVNPDGSQSRFIFFVDELTGRILIRNEGGGPIEMSQMTEGGFRIPNRYYDLNGNGRPDAVSGVSVQLKGSRTNPNGVESQVIMIERYCQRIEEPASPTPTGSPERR